MHTADALGLWDIHAHLASSDALVALHRLAPDLVPDVQRHPDGAWTFTRPQADESQPLEAGLVDVDTRLKDMAAQGISHQAIGPWTSLYLYGAPAERAAELVAINNDGLVAVATEHPDHFAAVVGLPMQDPDAAVREIQRVGAIDVVVGVQIGTVVAGRDLDDEQFAPVWAALEANRLPVIIHPYGPGNAGAARLQGYHLSNLIGNPLESSIAMARLAFSGVGARHPQLKFAFVHGGGFAPYQLGRWDHGWRVRDEGRVDIDEPPTTYIDDWYFDSLTHDPRSLKFLGERFGWSRVLIGTDYPWDMSSTDPVGTLRAAGVDDDTLAMIGNANAHRFLRFAEGRRQS